MFANASLQWVPDHPAVLARWWAALAPGGQLAVQIPSNADHASHRVAVEVASDEPFLSAMGGQSPSDPVADNVLRPEQYAVLLDDLGAVRQHVRLQVYGHLLDRSSDVVEWVKGTSLTRFAKACPPTSTTSSSTSTAARLLAAIGDTAPYFYPFKRILFWALEGLSTSGPLASVRVAVEAPLGRPQAVPLLAVVHRPVVDAESNGADRVLRATELLAPGRRACGCTPSTGSTSVPGGSERSGSKPMPSSSSGVRNNGRVNRDQRIGMSSRLKASPGTIGAIVRCTSFRKVCACDIGTRRSHHGFGRLGRFVGTRLDQSRKSRSVIERLLGDVAEPGRAGRRRPAGRRRRGS